jgi:hypothetical protein
MFEGVPIGERFTILWESICRNADKDIREVKYLQKFVEIYRNVLTEN